MIDKTQRASVLLNIAMQQMGTLLNAHPDWMLYAFLDPLNIDDEKAADATSPETSMQLDLVKREIPIVHANMPVNKHPCLQQSTETHYIAQDRLAQYTFEQMLAQTFRDAEPGEGRAYPWCALLLTKMPIDALLTALAESAIVYQANGKEHIFRYWDPRVAWQLTSIPTLHFLLAQKFIGHWLFVNGYGQFTCFSRLEPLAHTQLVLDESAFQRAQGASERSMLFDYAVCRDGVPIPDIHQRLEAELEIAHSMGLQDAALIHFASKRYQLKAPLERAPRMQKMLRDLREYGIDYMDVQREWDDDDWQAIAAEAFQAQAGGRL